MFTVVWTQSASDQLADAWVNPILTRGMKSRRMCKALIATCASMRIGSANLANLESAF